MTTLFPQTNFYLPRLINNYAISRVILFKQLKFHTPYNYKKMIIFIVHDHENNIKIVFQDAETQIKMTIKIHLGTACVFFCSFFAFSLL